MEVGWNDGDIDDLLDRMLQQNAQDQSHTARPSAGGELLPNIWSPPSDIDVKIEVGAAGQVISGRRGRAPPGHARPTFVHPPPCAAPAGAPPPSAAPHPPAR